MIISPNHKTHIMGKDSPGVGRYDATSEKLKITKPNQSTFKFNKGKRFVSIVNAGRNKDAEG